MGETERNKLKTRQIYKSDHTAWTVRPYACKDQSRELRRWALSSSFVASSQQPSGGHSHSDFILACNAFSNPPQKASGSGAMFQEDPGAPQRPHVVEKPYASKEQSRELSRWALSSTFVASSQQASGVWQQQVVIPTAISL